MSIHPLVTEYKNLIESEAAKHAKFLPIAVVEAEAYHIANDAAKSFDPKEGNRFSTHLTSQLKKLSRLSTEYGGAVRMPEHAQYDLNSIHRYAEEYKGSTGRDPSVAEISKGTKLSLSKVNNLMKGAKTSQTMSSQVNDPIFVDHKGELDDWIHMVYHDLPEKDKIIFEHYTGFGGKKLMTEDEIGKHIGMSPTVVGRRIKIIGDQIAKGVS